MPYVTSHHYKTTDFSQAVGLGLLLRSIKGDDDEDEGYQPVYQSSPSYGYGHARKGRARHGRHSHGRGRRSIGAGEEEEVVAELEEMSREKAFSLVASFEPQQCIKRLVCGLSTGAMGDDDTGIMSAFKVKINVIKHLGE